VECLQEETKEDEEEGIEHGQESSASQWEDQGQGTGMTLPQTPPISYRWGGGGPPGNTGEDMG
jgi:hypothetical protein